MIYIRTDMFYQLGAALLLLFSLAACSRQTPQVPCYLTWSVEGKTYPDFPLPDTEAYPARGDFPVAGVVSHHLLSGVLISSWFGELARMRTVETFFILSPRHWGPGTGPVSLTDGSWQTQAGMVQSDSAIVRRLAAQWQIEPDSTSFYKEHGVSVLIPFIKQYFPGARVVAVAFPVGTDVNLPVVRKLAETLLPFFAGKQRLKNFLLVSADFSHHRDAAATLRNDNRSRRFFSDPGLKTWFFTTCDNQLGIYALAALSSRMANSVMTIFFHSNSFLLSGMGADDITSYFFAFLSAG